jgi:hypothetical protein
LGSCEYEVHFRPFREILAGRLGRNRLDPLRLLQKLFYALSPAPSTTVRRISGLRNQ